MVSGSSPNPQYIKGHFSFSCALVRRSFSTPVKLHLLLGLHIDLRAAAALVALSGDNLVVVGTQSHACSGVSPLHSPHISHIYLFEHTFAGPGVEVVLHVHAASNPLLGANRPVLLESPSTLNRRLVIAGRLGDLISAAISLEGALLVGIASGIVRAVRFDDVVFNEGVASPAVDCQVAVALGAEVAAVVDGAKKGVSDQL